MPRPVRPWFRFYVEALHDPKLRRLPVGQRWVWVAVLAAARKSCVPGVLLVSERQPMDDTDLADLAAVPIRDVRKALEAMEASGMIQRDPAIGALVVTKWPERQYESDTSTERTRKHRSYGGRRNVPTSFSGTPPETETEPEPSSSSGNSRANGQPVDNPDDDDVLAEVPGEVWVRYAELMLERQPAGSVKAPVAWKRRARENAHVEHGDTAARWWAEYHCTPRYLAECLADGRTPRGEFRRKAAT